MGGHMSWHLEARRGRSWQFLNMVQGGTWASGLQLSGLDQRQIDLLHLLRTCTTAFNLLNARDSIDPAWRNN